MKHYSWQQENEWQREAAEDLGIFDPDDQGPRDDWTLEYRSAPNSLIDLVLLVDHCGGIRSLWCVDPGILMKFCDCVQAPTDWHVQVYEMQLDCPGDYGELIATRKAHALEVHKAEAWKSIIEPLRDLM